MHYCISISGIPRVGADDAELQFQFLKAGKLTVLYSCQAYSLSNTSCLYMNSLQSKHFTIISDRLEEHWVSQTSITEAFTARPVRHEHRRPLSTGDMQKQNCCNM